MSIKQRNTKLTQGGLTEMYNGRRTIRARFNGVCRGCDKPIKKGEIITFQSAFKSWHKKCWEVANSKRRADEQTSAI